MVNKGKGGSAYYSLALYLDNSLTLDEQFKFFQNSLQMVSTFNIGLESFLLTSPAYFGVKQHPEFETIANQFLDTTIRKWQLSHLHKQ